jgi:flavin-dependent dehydrogenase
MEKIELFRSVPELNVYDVIVVGAGPAGICAAVTAARSGMKTALIERYGTLGGNLTVGHVGPILGSVGPRTIRDELMTLLQVPDNDELGVVGVAHDFEQAKVTLVKYVDDAGVDTYLQSPVVEVIKENNHIKAVIISGKEGLFALSGDIYIDATGDGDVASMSGCKIMMGRDSDNLVQPVTL